MSKSSAASTAAPNSRANAARKLGRILSGADADAVLADASPEQRETCYGSLRRLPSLRAHLAEFMRKPLRPGDRDVECILLVGTYQLCEMSAPSYAVVNDCVDAAGRLGKPWAKGLVNAVLRKTGNAPLKPDERSFDHSQWLFKAIRRDYPDQWRALLEANNSRAPMWLRANTRRSEAPAVRAACESAGHATSDGAFPESFRLEKARPTAELPGFASGDVAVQDHSAQAVARCLFADAKKRLARPPKAIVDACAAPGGKTFHLTELCGSETTVVAIEASAERAEHMASESRRLGHSNIEIVVADAASDEWPMPESTELVLLDAPCSGTGTLRRHPDIKVHRRRADVHRAAALQQRLLAALWRRLPVGATLCYCTCSILSDENDGVIGQFLQTLSEGEAEPSNLSLPWGQSTEFGWQSLPGDAGGDGFYLCGLRRAAAPPAPATETPEATPQP